MNNNFDIAEHLRGMIGMELILTDAANEINILRNALLSMVMDKNECKFLCNHECPCKKEMDTKVRGENIHD